LLSEVTLLCVLSLYLDRPLAQRKAKSKVKVTHCLASMVSLSRWVCSIVGCHLVMVCGRPSAVAWTRRLPQVNIKTHRNCWSTWWAVSARGLTRQVIHLSVIQVKSSLLFQ